MNAGMPGRESLNGASEPGRDLLKIDVCDGAKSVRVKNRCHAGWLETAVQTLTNFVQPRAQDDDLPNPSFNSSCQSIFRNPASRGGDQASDAGQWVFVRKLKHVLFRLHSESSWQMGH